MNILKVLKFKFFSSVKNECISKKDYLCAIDVWNVFKLNTMGDYHDFYLKTDVLLLDDVFEKLIHTCVEYYGSDPCHYFSSPRLRSDAMLQITWIKLEPFSAIGMHFCIKKKDERGYFLHC